MAQALQHITTSQQGGGGASRALAHAARRVPTLSREAVLWGRESSSAFDLSRALGLGVAVRGDWA